MLALRPLLSTRRFEFLASTIIASLVVYQYWQHRHPSRIWYDRTASISDEDKLLRMERTVERGRRVIKHDCSVVVQVCGFDVWCRKKIYKGTALGWVRGSPIVYCLKMKSTRVSLGRELCISKGQWVSMCRCLSERKSRTGRRRSRGLKPSKLQKT